MAKKTAPLLPASQQRLMHFGERLRLARLRRRLTAKQVAERSGMTPITLRNLERGGSGVTIGAYLAVMQALGLDQDLDRLVQDDPLGRELQDAALPQRARAKSASTVPSNPAGRASASATATRRKSSPKWAAEGSFVSAAELADLLDQPKARTPRRKR